MADEPMHPEDEIGRATDEDVIAGEDEFEDDDEDLDEDDSEDDEEA